MIPYKDIFIALNEAKVDYLVAGGIAVNLHQIVRATMDLDLIVHLEKKNILQFVQVMTKLGLVPRVPVSATDLAEEEKRKSWILEKNMVIFSFINPQNPMEVVDVFVQEPFPFKEAFERKLVAKAYGTEIPVLNIQDLIDLKTKAGREKDLYDINLLRKKL